GSSPRAWTPAGSRPAGTRAGSPRRWSSAARAPRPRSADGLQVGAAAQVARERGGRDLGHVQALLVLLDLLAGLRRLALALAQLVAVRRPDEAQVVAPLAVLHEADANDEPRTTAARRERPCRRARRRRCR